jgi:hypothetical protein
MLSLQAKGKHVNNAVAMAMPKKSQRQSMAQPTEMLCCPTKTVWDWQFPRCSSLQDMERDL